MWMPSEAFFRWRREMCENRDLTWPALSNGFSTSLDILAYQLEGANMATKPTIDDIRSYLSKTDIECLDDKYRGINSIYSFRCSKGHEFRTFLDDIRTSLERHISPCPLCSLEDRGGLLYPVGKVILSQARKWLRKLGIWFGTHRHHKTLSDYCPKCEILWKANETWKEFCWLLRWSWLWRFLRLLRMGLLG